jgi:CPA2 family monovalent cation:H+ antiporter-2
MGALMNFELLPRYALEIAAFLGTAISAKFLATYLSARQQRVAVAEARLTAINLSASGGELSLVVAKGGADVGVTSSFVLPFVGALTIVTTFLSPYLVRWAWRAAAPGGSPPPNSTPAGP